MSTFDNSGGKSPKASSKSASTNGPKKGSESHDSEAPPSLISFMLKGWTPRNKKIVPIAHLANFQKRRDSLSVKFHGELLVIPAGHLKVRANDTFYPFRPCSDFFYLTGNMEPDCVLVLMPEGNKHRHLLFVEPNPGKTDPTFFTDRLKGELWEGARLGVKESSVSFGIEAKSLTELSAFLASFSGSSKGKRFLRGHSAPTEGMMTFDDPAQSLRDTEFAISLSEMRLLKEDIEVRALNSAIDSTKRGFEDVVTRLKTARGERELEGVFFTRARMEGNDIGYGSIIASGPHACTLHWKRNDGKLRSGDLLLMDAGIEGNSLYTADITRCFPINGKFSKEQREVYELVLAAQKAAMKEVKPGNDFLAPNRAAMKVFAMGLDKMGLLPMGAQEALKPENQFFKRYTLHNVSHMLGLDVHDCAKARAETYKFGLLEAGMVLTVEPGLYFQPDDGTVPAKYRGIGVRIEDDVLVTKTGFKNLSASIPSEVDAVEKWMKSCWKKKN